MCVCQGGVKVLITGPWQEANSQYSCLFDQISVPASLIQPGVLRCYCPGKFSLIHIHTYRKLSDQTKWIIISSNRDQIIINTLCMFYCNLLQCRNCCPRNIPPATCILIEPDLYSLLGPLLLNHTWELLAELSWALMWFSLCIALMTNACVALFVSL